VVVGPLGGQPGGGTGDRGVVVAEVAQFLGAVRGQPPVQPGAEGVGRAQTKLRRAGRAG